MYVCQFMHLLYYISIWQWLARHRTVLQDGQSAGWPEKMDILTSPVYFYMNLSQFTLFVLQIDHPVLLCTFFYLRDHP